MDRTTMRKLIVLSLIPFAVMAQDRKFNLTITQTNEATVTGERNYREKFGIDKYEKNVCIVDTELQIDGVWHKAHGEYSGVTKDEACKTASLIARKELTTSIKPSIISSKSEITYEESGHAKHIDGYKKGDLVDVGGLNRNPSYPNDFRDQGTICRWFYDVKRVDKGIRQYNLIACKLADGWIVADTF